MAEEIARTYVRITPDTTGFREEAKAEVDKATAGLDETVHVKADTSEASKGIGNLATALMALGPALVPVGAAAVGIGAGLSTAFAAAGLGALGFAAVTKTVFTQVSADLKKAHGDISQLPQDEQAAATALVGLRQAWQGFVTALQPQVLAAANAGLTTARQVLPELAPLVSTTAGAFTHLATEAGTALTSPYWVHFFGFLSSQAGPAITTFGSSVGNLATGFSGLLQAFAPLTAQMETGLVNITQDFANWGTHIGTTSAFHSFLTYTQQVGPQVAHTFGDIVTALGKVLAAAAPLGPPMLTLVDVLAKVVGFAPGLAAFGLVAVGWASAISKMSTAMKSLTESKAVETLTGIGSTVATLGPTTTAVLGLNSAFAGLQGALSKIGTVALALAPIAALAAGFAILTSRINEAKQAGADMAQVAIAGAGQNIDNQITAVKAKIAELQKIADQGIHLSIGPIKLDSSEAAAKAGNQIRGLKGALTELTVQQKAQEAADRAASASMAGYASQIGETTNQLKRDTQALDDNAKAVQAQFDPVIALGRALDQQTAARNALTAAQIKYGASSEQAKAAGLDLASATEGVTVATDALSKAYLNGQITTAGMTGQLRTWVAQGLLTQGQADQVAGSLQGVINKAGELQGRNVNVKVSADTTTAVNQLNATADLLRSLDGKVSVVTIKTINDQVTKHENLDAAADRTHYATGGYPSLTEGALWTVGEEGIETMGVENGRLRVYSAPQTHRLVAQSNTTARDQLALLQQVAAMREDMATMTAEMTGLRKEYERTGRAVRQGGKP